MNIPDDRKYTKEHEWIKIENDVAYVGITSFAQSELGDIIFIEFPSVGDEFKANDIFGTIEAVKTVADLYIPVDSTILEVNEKLEDTPEIVNSDAEKEGWIVKIKIKNNDSLNNLLSLDQYNEFIE